MLKIVVIVIVALVAVFTLLVFLGREGRSQGIPASFADLPEYFAGLLASEHPRAFLIVTVPRTDDFIQFHAITDGVEMDFPLITDRQKASERRIRDACAAKGLVARKTFGSGGERFLDFDVEGNVESITKTVAELFATIYGVSPSEPLSVIVEGWETGSTSQMTGEEGGSGRPPLSS